MAGPRPPIAPLASTVRVEMRSGRYGHPWIGTCRETIHPIPARPTANAYRNGVRIVRLKKSGILSKYAA
jgi:hypothetical protein